VIPEIKIWPIMWPTYSLIQSMHIEVWLNFYHDISVNNYLQNWESVNCLRLITQIITQMHNKFAANSDYSTVSGTMQ